MAARFGPKAGWKGSAKTEVQPLWRGNDQNDMNSQLKLCSTVLRLGKRHGKRGLWKHHYKILRQRWRKLQSLWSLAHLEFNMLPWLYLLWRKNISHQRILLGAFAILSSRWLFPVQKEVPPNPLISPLQICSSLDPVPRCASWNDWLSGLDWHEAYKHWLCSQIHSKEPVNKETITITLALWAFGHIWLWLAQTANLVILNVTKDWLSCHLIVKVHYNDVVNSITS